MTLLTVDGIHTFYEHSHVLHGVSLDVDEGEVVTLLGRNGAGKTTTLRSIMGVAPPRDGRITFRGEEITGLAVDEISTRGLKMVPEDRRIFPALTVHQNLTLASKLAADPRPVEEMYELFRTLDPLRNNKGRNLSGGEQQMLAIARSLIQQPDLLMLDEPTEGLAPVIIEDLREMLRRTVAGEDITVLLTEQNVAFAFDLAQRGYIIDTGEIVFDGTMDELSEREDLLEQYLAVSVE